ncbi:hypothetical protein [Shimazuella alba]|uniref:Uncharacterized protein n=1 Tax=Shimazuella alba TaxID=2690964 RepID=A0A6I4VTX5_9BACL|nr:hypothetical protein [Shimazuella alba]MXQ54463.1 hypothetical protein [Shimazuella alba]
MIRVSPEQLVDELQRKLTDNRIYVNVVLRNGRVEVSTGKVPTDVTGMSVDDAYKLIEQKMDMAAAQKK